jgi:hypothetical protein
MSLADLVRAEAALPEDPPESESCPDPPQDWQDLDGSPPPESGAVVGSALERRLSALIALAA